MSSGSIAEYDYVDRIAHSSDEYVPEGGWQGEEFYDQADEVFLNKDDLSELFGDMAERLGIEENDVWDMYFRSRSPR